MQAQTVTGPIGLDQLGRTLMLLHARGLSDHEIHSILDDNPRRFLAGEALPLLNKA